MTPLDAPIIEILATPRTTCLKCGDGLPRPPVLNVGNDVWCGTCQYLLGVGGQKPGPVTLVALGLDVPNADKQAAEAIPSSRHVEHWYDPDVAEGTIPFDRLISAALRSAA